MNLSEKNLLIGKNATDTTSTTYQNANYPQSTKINSPKSLNNKPITLNNTHNFSAGLSAAPSVSSHQQYSQPAQHFNQHHHHQQTLPYQDPQQYHPQPNHQPPVHQHYPIPPPPAPVYRQQPHYNPYQAPPPPPQPPKFDGTRNTVRHAKGSAMFNSVNTSAKIPACAMCYQLIRGPFISAVGKEWCPNHFVCAQPSCGINLQDVGFVEENDKLYCERDYEKYFAPTCSKCQKRILGVSY